MNENKIIGVEVLARLKDRYGDVYPDEVLALAQEHYGVIPAEDQLPDRIRPEEPPQRAERRMMARVVGRSR